MIGIDTNILIRFLTRDDPAQWRIARAVLTEQISEDTPGWISCIVIAETAWVLRSTYGYTNADIAGAIDSLILGATLVMEHEPQVVEAVYQARENGFDLADVLIASLAEKAGCTHTLTFDRKAARLPGFQLAT